jgi:hypothetical protein
LGLPDRQPGEGLPSSCNQLTGRDPRANDGFRIGGQQRQIGMARSDPAKMPKTSAANSVRSNFLK